MTPMRLLTATSAVPSGTTILASTPSSTASYSIVALSVSISAITSPVLTGSPSFLRHLARLPFSIVGDSAGMRMLMGMVRQFHQKRASAITNSLGRLDHFGDGRQCELFQVRGIRHRHVLAGHAHDRRVEIIERILHHARRDLGADAGLLPAFLDGNEPTGLLHGLDDGVAVHRLEGAQIDHL